MPSEMDLIYDDVVANEKLKDGTKYEMLTALVFKLLHPEALVQHDVVLRGDGKATPHQMDVIVGDASNRKRILIECKDYDKVIGVGIIRDFFGAVHQLKPDAAYVISTKGFTKPAKSFASEENIQLAILKEYEVEPNTAYVGRIVLRGCVRFSTSFGIGNWIVASAEEYERAMNLHGDRIGGSSVVQTTQTFFYDEAGHSTESFEEVLAPIVAKIVHNFAGDEGMAEGAWNFDHTRYVHVLGDLVAVKGFEYRCEIGCIQKEIEMHAAGGIAKLILKTLDGTINRRIMDEELKGFVFDEDGNVVER